MGWVVLNGRVVHVYVHGEVMLWVVSTSLLLSMAVVVCLECRSCGGVLSRGVGKTLIGGAQSETTHRVVSNLYNSS